MLNFKSGLKVSGLAIVATALLAIPAQAQIGSVTGSVNGTVNGTVGARVETPRPRVRAEVPVSARVKTTSRTRGRGTHYHGSYAHDHGHFGYDHVHHSDHSHTHGYARVSVKIDARGDRRDIGPMLTYGMKVESRKGEYLGRIIGISQTESGMVTSIVVDGVPKPIPVETLRAEGDFLVTSKKKKHLI